MGVLRSVEVVEILELEETVEVIQVGHHSFFVHMEEQSKEDKNLVQNYRANKRETQA